MTQRGATPRSGTFTPRVGGRPGMERALGLAPAPGVRADIMSANGSQPASRRSSNETPRIATADRAAERSAGTPSGEVNPPDARALPAAVKEPSLGTPPVSSALLGEPPPPARGGSTVGTKNPLRAEQEILKQGLAKDRVAFLMYRAPTTSQPSADLKKLELADPRVHMGSTHRANFCMENHFQEAPRELKWERRRDRVTEYTEVKLMQANIGFRQ